MVRVRVRVYYPCTYHCVPQVAGLIEIGLIEIRRFFRKYTANMERVGEEEIDFEGYSKMMREVFSGSSAPGSAGSAGGRGALGSGEEARFKPACHRRGANIGASC